MSSVVDREAFNPLVAALEAWQEADGPTTDASALEHLGQACFGEHLMPGYLSRFLTFEVHQSRHPIGKLQVDGALVEQAFVEAEAALRKLVVENNPGSKFDSDDRFENFPRYVSALGILDRLEPALRGLADLDLSRCPKCTMIGETDAWFGYRLMDGKTHPQSWCRICRALDGARHADAGPS